MHSDLHRRILSKEIRVRFHRILGFPRIFGKIRGPFFTGFGFFRLRSTRGRCQGFKRGRNAGWSPLFSVNVDQGRKKSVGCFSIFCFLFLFDVEVGREEKKGKFGYKITTKLRVHKSHIIFQIKIVIYIYIKKIKS